MYFLSDIEQKQLLYQLLPTAREVGVSKELRGWNWHQPPLKPYFDNVRLPMYQVSSKYCPTNRDVYLRNVEKKYGAPNARMALGKLFHGIVSDCLQSFRQRQNITFDAWWQKIRWQEISEKPENTIDKCRQVWDFVQKMCDAQLAERSCSQPYSTEMDLISTAVPFLVEHKLSGELLGLSDILSVDCFDYLRTIMFDLKVTSFKENWHRLYSLGYALVFESIHEVPVDICCTVYLNVENGKISVQKDLFFANDELRQWWLEERDRKLEIVAERRDPGKPECSQCKEYCQYYNICYG
ncbi:MAG: type I-A CRISPR-associated protein Cas4/Csa1 [Candidatus Bathyarchaeia archaeon]|jgi:CRISPR-associated protein Csa1